ncbi:sulfate/molybdate ABC transporter ATP-binding protein [Dermabacter vaginalis]|uniref:sulfate/molybdate ABC transporter ATP-binding protein n=1 Tax=Dermabacter vaginalis TaxID=1630135 RepID=UPI001EF67EAA|nr:ATP-binding cassette domain-containing protein [Dermabacter vaginalis]MCG7443094.1 ATP-binding cassette domain-containing protein [Dermabacter vaginalis]
MTLSIEVVCPERGVETSLEVAAGEHVALVGPNGAGKSTVLDATAGLLRKARATRVRVSLDGEELSRVPVHRRGFASLSQSAHLFLHMNVLDNIAYGLVSKGATKRVARERARALCAEVGLEELEHRRPSTLSGGQAQKCALARALAIEPRVLLLDEPMAALDVRAAREMRGLISRLSRSRTLIFATHDMLDVLAWADRVCVLESGRVVEVGECDAALASPHSEFLAELAGLQWVEGEVRARGVFVTRGGIALEATGECRLGPARALIDPRALRLREESPSAASGAGTIRGLSRIGHRPVVYVEDVPVELSAHEEARGAVAEGHTATILQSAPVKVKPQR